MSNQLDQLQDYKLELEKGVLVIPSSRFKCMPDYLYLSTVVNAVKCIDHILSMVNKIPGTSDYSISDSNAFYEYTVAKDAITVLDAGAGDIYSLDVLHDLCLPTIYVITTTLLWIFGLQVLGVITSSFCVAIIGLRIYRHMMYSKLSLYDRGYTVDKLIQLISTIEELCTDRQYKSTKLCALQPPMVSGPKYTVSEHYVISMQKSKHRLLRIAIGYLLLIMKRCTKT